MNTANPALGSSTFSRLRGTAAVGETMTIQGTVIKSFVLLFCVLLTAGYTWNLYMKAGNPNAVSGLMMLGVFGGLIAAIVTIFKPAWASITAPIYALLEGLFIGGISAVLNASYPGIAIQAAGLTVATLASMLVAYQTGLVRATEKFKLGVFAATGGIAIVYLVAIVLSFFGINLSFIYGSGLFSILFSLFVVGIAALNLVIDFDTIEQGARAQVPRFMEWYGAFALMVTLVWLYIEILRLLAKLRDNR